VSVLGCLCVATRVTEPDVTVQCSTATVFLHGFTFVCAHFSVADRVIYEQISH
jgi:hypothetical protein